MPLGIDFAQILLHLFNFVILFAGLKILVWQPVKAFMQQRNDRYKEMHEQAEQTLTEASEMKTTYEKKMHEAEAEIEEMRSAAKREAQESAQRIEDEAKESAQRILAEAKTEAEEKKAAIVSSAMKDLTEVIEESAKKALLGNDTSGMFDAFLDQAGEEEA
ncbi:MAG: ATP synthase F0 subunit B [Lachnospiraceae bacterium]|nr:ATP synthase F0 subunit B [Lachnospiraceae bacterium]